jgi:hypothetical protein
MKRVINVFSLFLVLAATVTACRSRTFIDAKPKQEEKEVYVPEGGHGRSFRRQEPRLGHRVAGGE